MSTPSVGHPPYTFHGTVVVIVIVGNYYLCFIFIFNGNNIYIAIGD